MKRIEQLVIEALQELFEMAPTSNNENLLDFISICNKDIVDLLYVFDYLEKRIGKPVSEILVNRNYGVLTVHEIAKAIEEDFYSCGLSN